MKEGPEAGNRWLLCLKEAISSQLLHGMVPSGGHRHAQWLKGAHEPFRLRDDESLKLKASKSHAKAMLLVKGMLKACGHHLATLEARNGACAGATWHTTSRTRGEH